MFIKLRKNAQKQNATVVSFKKEKIQSLRNNFTKIEYPYIKLANEDAIVRLSNADSLFKLYKINEKVEVFHHQDKWLDWHMYDKGLYRFIPYF